MKLSKRWLSALLAFVMVVTLLPVTTFAAGGTGASIPETSNKILYAENFDGASATNWTFTGEKSKTDGGVTNAYMADGKVTVSSKRVNGTVDTPVAKYVGTALAGVKNYAIDADLVLYKEVIGSTAYWPNVTLCLTGTGDNEIRIEYTGTKFTVQKFDRGVTSAATTVGTIAADAGDATSYSTHFRAEVEITNDADLKITLYMADGKVTWNHTTNKEMNGQFSWRSYNTKKVGATYKFDVDNIVVSDMSHNLTKYVAGEATCTNVGCDQDHWYCADCDKNYVDNKESAVANVVTTPVQPHKPVNTVPAEPATKYEDGNEAYATCQYCAQYIMEENGEWNVVAENAWVLDSCYETIAEEDFEGVTSAPADWNFSRQNDSDNNNVFWAFQDKATATVVRDASNAGGRLYLPAAVAGAKTLVYNLDLISHDTGDGKLASFYYRANGTSSIHIVRNADNTIKLGVQAASSYVKADASSFKSYKAEADADGSVTLKMQIIHIVDADGLTYRFIINGQDCGYATFKNQTIATPYFIITATDTKNFGDYKASFDNMSVYVVNHVPTEVKASAPDCLNDGVFAHYHCDVCGNYSDANGIYEMTTVVDPALGHAFNAKASGVIASEATCESAQMQFVQCDRCDVISDTVTVPVGPADHIFSNKVSDKLAKEATCISGALYYLACDRCGEPSKTLTAEVGEPGDHLFLDKPSKKVATEANCYVPATYYVQCEGCALIHETKTVVVGEANGHALQHTAEVPATCTKNGMKEYWYCADCDTFYDSEEAKMPVAYLSLTTLAHGLKHNEEIPATCAKNGVKENWYCESCDVYYDNAEGMYPIAYLSLTIPAHGLTHTAEVPATCNKTGMKEYWYCATCDVFYDNADGLYPVAYLSLTILPHELTHVEEVPATCTKNGVKEYWYCATCDVFFDSAEAKLPIAYLSLTIPAHELKHEAEVWNGCAEKGMKEYWYCVACDVYYEDAECTKITNRLSLVISHSVEHHAEVWNGCAEQGMKEYWYCSTCDVYYADAACTIVTNAKDLVISHSVEHKDEVWNGCAQQGMKEYWYCSTCDVYYADAACTIVTNAKDLVISHSVEHKDEVWNGCTEQGMKEYWYCSTCDVYYADAACTIVTNAKDLVISHSVEHHAEEWKGCAEQGMKEYWYCSTCDVYYADEACTIVTNAKDLVISHSVESAKEVWNGCLNGGMQAYWYCSTCDVYYADEACTIVTNAKNLVIPAHNVKHVEKVEATATENGMMEHWYCEECDVYYADAECKQVTNAKNLTIEATGNAATGDNSAIFMMIAVAIVAATSVTALVITKKRFF